MAECVLTGAARAKGDVLTFLDAHCECTHGWLEPLLHEIHQDRSVSVSSACDAVKITVNSAIPSVGESVSAVP